jgi:hypothetical protein
VVRRRRSRRRPAPFRSCPSFSRGRRTRHLHLSAGAGAGVRPVRAGALAAGGRAGAGKNMSAVVGGAVDWSVEQERGLGLLGSKSIGLAGATQSDLRSTNPMTQVDPERKFKQVGGQRSPTSRAPRIILRQNPGLSYGTCFAGSGSSSNLVSAALFPPIRKPQLTRRFRASQ